MKKSNMLVVMAVMACSVVANAQSIGGGFQCKSPYASAVEAAKVDIPVFYNGPNTPQKELDVWCRTGNRHYVVEGIRFTKANPGTKTIFTLQGEFGPNTGSYARYHLKEGKAQGYINALLEKVPMYRPVFEAASSSRP
jgi:hypothetical protein